MSSQALSIGRLLRLVLLRSARLFADLKKKFIAVTCHYDVVDWLDPDWVFCTDTMEFDRKKEARPPVELKVYRCGAHLWKMFRQYHYLNGSLGAGVRCYTAIYQDKPVAFIAVVHIKMKSRYYQG